MNISVLFSLNMSFFYFLLKVDSSLTQYILTTVLPPSSLQQGPPSLMEDPLAISDLDSLSIMSGCSSLYPLQSADGGSLFDDDWTKHWSMNIAEYY